MELYTPFLCLFLLFLTSPVLCLVSLAYVRKYFSLELLFLVHESCVKGSKVDYYYQTFILTNSLFGILGKLLGGGSTVFSCVLLDLFFQVRGKTSMQNNNFPCNLILYM